MNFNTQKLKDDAIAKQQEVVDNSTASDKAAEQKVLADTKAASVS